MRPNGELDLLSAFFVTNDIFVCRVELGVTLVEDHSISSKMQLLLKLNDEEKVVVTESSVAQAKSRQNFICELCRRIGASNKGLMSEEQIFAHIRAK